MHKLPMSREEICRRYRGAEDRRKQPAILAQLNACSEQEIVRILEEDGEVLPSNEAAESQPEKKRGFPEKWTPERVEELKKQAEAGKNVRELADYFGITPPSMSALIKRKGISVQKGVSPWRKFREPPGKVKSERDRPGPADGAGAPPPWESAALDALADRMDFAVKTLFDDFGRDLYELGAVREGLQVYRERIHQPTAEP